MQQLTAYSNSNGESYFGGRIKKGEEREEKEENWAKARTREDEDSPVTGLEEH